MLQAATLALDTIDRPTPEDEAQLGLLMFQQLKELSDIDSDVWDYCSFRWLTDAKSAEQFVVITHDAPKVWGLAAQVVQITAHVTTVCGHPTEKATGVFQLGANTIEIVRSNAACNPVVH